MHDNFLINTDEFNLLYDIINTSKCTKNTSSNYSPILHRCMNTRIGGLKHQNFYIF